MPPGRFYYLLGAMLDVMAPEQTEPVEDRATRLAREKVMAAVQRAKSRGRRR